MPFYNLTKQRRGGGYVRKTVQKEQVLFCLINILICHMSETKIWIIEILQNPNRPNVLTLCY